MSVDQFSSTDYLYSKFFTHTFLNSCLFVDISNYQEFLLRNYVIELFFSFFSKEKGLLEKLCQNLCYDPNVSTRRQIKVERLLY